LPGIIYRIEVFFEHFIMVSEVKEIKKWYAVYTHPRSEKKALLELQKNDIECYLPIVKTLRQWSDRKKWVDEPLFRSYLFVHVSTQVYFDVLNTQFVVRYITFEGAAVPIPDLQIEAIKLFIKQEELPHIDPRQFQPGKSVEVIKGNMKGLIGDLITHAGKHKVKIEVSGIGQSVYITLPMSYLKILK